MARKVFPMLTAESAFPRGFTGTIPLMGRVDFRAQVRVYTKGIMACLPGSMV